MADYDDLLNMTWGDIPDDLILPDGKWLVRGGNAALVKPRDEKQSLKVLFNYVAKEPVEVDDDLLEEMGDVELDQADLTYTIYIEKPKDWKKVFKHLAIHGIEMEEGENLFTPEGKLAFAKKFKGTTAVAVVGHRSWQDANGDTQVGNSLSGFSKVDE